MRCDNLNKNQQENRYFIKEACLLNNRIRFIKLPGEFQTGKSDAHWVKHNSGEGERVCECLRIYFKERQ